MSERWDALWARASPEAEQPGDTVARLPPATDGSTQYGRRALEGECRAVARAVEGERNDTLNRAWFRMGRLVPQHLDEATVREALGDAGRRCGLPEWEVDLVLRTDETSAGRAGQSVPRQPRPREPLPDPTVLASEPAEDRDSVATFWTERETLAHLHAFARARCVAPWAVLGAALTRVVAATAPHITIPPIVGAYASLNLFVALVGRSGSGKGAAESVARDALDVGYIETRNTGSGEGAVHAYARRVHGEIDQHTTAVLFSIPEIDSLGALGARTGSTLMPLLRSGWSGEQLGFAYADPNKNLTVPRHRYRMCLIAGVQPDRAGVLLNDADGGTPQRFLWLPATDPTAPAELPEAPKPRGWKQPRPPQLFTDPSGFNPVEVCDTAVQTIRENRVRSLQGDGDALDGHALLTRLKVAVALALLEERLEVTEDDWRLSGVVADVSAATRGAVMDRLRAKLDAANEARAHAEAARAVTVEQVKKDKALVRVRATALKALAVHGEQGRSALRKRIAQRDRDLLDEAIDGLLEEGRIESADVEYHGQPGARLRLVRQ